MTTTNQHPFLLTPAAIKSINAVGFAHTAALREQRRQRAEDEELDRQNPTRQLARREAFEDSKPFDIF